MRGFFAILRVTLRQLLGGRRLLLFALLALAPTLVMWLSSADLPDDEVGAAFQEAPLLIMFLMVIPVVSLVLGAGALGDERRDGTLSFLLLRPQPRSVVTAAKLVAAWLATAGIVGIAAALAAAVVGIRTGDWGYVVPAVVAVAIGCLGYCAVFLILGYFTSRAVLVGLIYVFIWENSISFAAPSLGNVSLLRIGLSAYVDLAPGVFGDAREALGVVAPGAGGAAVKAVLLAAFVVAWVATLLRRRDLT